MVTHLEWLCIGGGPCGTTTVGAALERGLHSVGWIEAGSFAQMGRLGARYEAVPANTRNDRLVETFSSLAAFDFEARQAERARAGEETLAAQPPSETCHLRLSVAALRDASKAMRASGRLDFVREGARVMRLSSDGTSWVASLENGDDVAARRVILATGAAPRPIPVDLAARLAEAGVAIVDHDDVVAPDLCAATHLGSAAVVGGAHSGMLAAMNLIGIGHATVRVYDRKPAPRFAEERDGWIKYDGTGLKGQCAEFVRNELSSLKPRIWYHHLADTEDLVDRLLADGVQAVAFTWGFEKQATLDVTWRGDHLNVFDGSRTHDSRTGRLAPGLYGVGLGFPEYWTDRDGFTEPRVGFVCHFLHHLDRLFDDAVGEAPDSLN